MTGRVDILRNRLSMAKKLIDLNRFNWILNWFIGLLRFAMVLFGSYWFIGYHRFTSIRNGSLWFLLVLIGSLHIYYIFYIVASSVQRMAEKKLIWTGSKKKYLLLLHRFTAWQKKKYWNLFKKIFIVALLVHSIA